MLSYGWWIAGSEGRIVGSSGGFRKVRCLKRQQIASGASWNRCQALVLVEGKAGWGFKEVSVKG